MQFGFDFNAETQRRKGRRGEPPFGEFDRLMEIFATSAPLRLCVETGSPFNCMDPAKNGRRWR